MTHVSRILAALLALALYSSHAHAAPTDADRAVAVRLVVEGRARFEAEQFDAALELFKRAHEIMHAPTTGLDLTKTHEALGHLIEARIVADEVVHIPVAANEKPIFAEARAQAKEAINDLDLRIPLLTLHVMGPPVQAARVSIDGKTLTSEEVGKPYAANPGKHTVVVTAPDYHPTEVTVSLVESKTTSLDVKLNAMVVQSPAPPSTPLVIKKDGVPPLVIAGFAVSGGLLVTSVITGVLSNVASQNAADALPANGCTPIDACRTTFYQQFDRGRAFGVVALASFGVGVGVGVAALIHMKTASKGSTTANAPKTSWIVSPMPAGIVVQRAW